MKEKGICWPHPQLTVEISTYELEHIQMAVQAQLKKDSDRRQTYQWILDDIEMMLHKAKKGQ